MQVTATEAKNRLGHMLDLCQQAPVTIEKSGRRHSVLLSAAQYDAMVVAALPKTAKPTKTNPGRDFYLRHKAWVDGMNTLVEQHGIPGSEHRVW
jgi:prevent-host-death family protein